MAQFLHRGRCSIGLAFHEWNRHYRVASPCSFIDTYNEPHSSDAFEVVDNDALEIRIYDGTNSSFVLYLDDGHDPSSDRLYCDILFVWNDEATSLTIEAAKGNRCDELSVPMQMDITLVAPGHGVGVSPSVPDVIVVYSGAKVVVPLAPAKREDIVE